MQKDNPAPSNVSGFTLLELIVVIIIVGVLAALALPRFFATIEYSRSTEAMNALGVIRKSVIRCGGITDNVVGCDNFAALDLNDPSSEPGAHFTYQIVITGANAFTISGVRNTLNGGTSGDTVNISVSAVGLTRSGTTAFSNIK